MSKNFISQRDFNTIADLIVKHKDMTPEQKAQKISDVVMYKRSKKRRRFMDSFNDAIDLGGIILAEKKKVDPYLKGAYDRSIDDSESHKRVSSGGWKGLGIGALTGGALGSIGAKNWIRPGSERVAKKYGKVGEAAKALVKSHGKTAGVIGGTIGAVGAGVAGKYIGRHIANKRSKEEMKNKYGFSELSYYILLGENIIKRLDYKKLSKIKDLSKRITEDVKKSIEEKKKVKTLSEFDYYVAIGNEIMFDDDFKKKEKKFGYMVAERGMGSAVGTLVGSVPAALMIHHMTKDRNGNKVETKSKEIKAKPFSKYRMQGKVARRVRAGAKTASKLAKGVH